VGVQPAAERDQERRYADPRDALMFPVADSYG